MDEAFARLLALINKKKTKSARKMLPFSLPSKEGWEGEENFRVSDFFARFCFSLPIRRAGEQEEGSGGKKKEKEKWT